ncbi:hypothetical protein AB0C59_19500 [Streptomyces sp. NPDC048664]|uniref:hypothetical protein n=1 Tax=Streptomyces sp. NPDC048664 TaxID=3154505 RepID=UPI00342B7EE5
MTVTTHALIPALQDARDTHAAVIDRFRMDMAVTPAGPHRRAMQRHLARTQGHMARIDDHVRAVRPRRLAGDAAAIARTLAAGAIRAAHLPIEVCALLAAGVLLGGRPADTRHLLLLIEGEYAATAHALAACRVGENVAALADDERAMELLGALRRQDEELLDTLEAGLDELARALVDTVPRDVPRTTARMSVVPGDRPWPGPVTPAAWPGSLGMAGNGTDTTG